MSNAEPVTLETDVVEEDAERDIASAVSSRHSIARKYVLRLRRKHPEASPAEIVTMLERHYAASINAAGAVITASGIAADIGISLIPLGGAAAKAGTKAGQQVAKKAAQEASKAALKQTAKTAAKGVALGAAKTAAQRVATLLPAGDRQLQFEITAIFGLAIADIHGMNLDKDQAHALVYGLTNERVAPQQIAVMAADLAKVRPETDGTDGSEDWSHWASTLADALPAGAAQSLVRTVQTGQLDTLRQGLDGKQQATIEYGVGALIDGVGRFVFGREVINAARAAFPPAPDAFPSYLAVPIEEDEGDDEPNRALSALETAARSTGGWIADSATTVGGGVATGAAAVGTGVVSAAGTVTRSFRSVDLDGDGIPDDPRALTAVKGVGNAVAGAADAVGGRFTGLFKKNRDQAVLD